MARKPRRYGETGIYHIIIRGNNRQNIFYDDNDRKIFISLLKKYTDQLNISVYAYCLMNNHVHLLIGKGNFLMSKLMLKLNTSYVRRFNIKYERTGHLFQGRYLSMPIENEVSFKKVIRYIIRNPQKAGISKYDEYEWSSFTEIKHSKIDSSAAIENENHKSVTDSSYIFRVFGGFKNFSDYVSLSNSDECMEYENKIILNDSRCLSIIREKLCVINPHSLQNLDRNTIIEKVSILKKNGIPSYKISRLTGISQSLIRRA